MTTPTKLPRVKRVSNKIGKPYAFYRNRTPDAEGRMLTPLPNLPDDDPAMQEAWATAVGADAARARAAGKATPVKPKPTGKCLAVLIDKVRSEPRNGVRKVFSEESAAYRRTLDGFFRDIEAAFAAAPVAGVMEKHILKHLAGYTPDRAWNGLKAWRYLFRGAVAYGWIAADHDPAAKVKISKPKNKPHKAWEPEDIEAYRQRWPLGTQRRLALELLYWHGPRRTDLVRLGPKHIRRGRIQWSQNKTDNEIAPRGLAPDVLLAIESLNRVRPGLRTFLETAYGEARTPGGFGGWFRASCDEAGLQGLSAHGMRHRLGSDAAEAGLSEAAIQELLGHATPDEARRYIQHANRQRIAAHAGTGLEAFRSLDTVVARARAEAEWERDEAEEDAKSGNTVPAGNEETVDNHRETLDPLLESVSRLASPRGLEPLFSP